MNRHQFSITADQVSGFIVSDLTAGHEVGRFSDEAEALAYVNREGDTPMDTIDRKAALERVLVLYDQRLPHDNAGIDLVVAVWAAVRGIDEDAATLELMEAS